MLKKLKNKKGEAYIDLIISFICLMLVLFAALVIFRMFAVRNNLDYAAKMLIQTATTHGTFGTSENGVTHFENHRNMLKTDLGFTNDLICDFSGTPVFFDGTAGGTSSGASVDYKVQLGDIMKLKVSTTASLGSGLLRVDLNISSTASGSSEKYWKEP